MMMGGPGGGGLGVGRRGDLRIAYSLMILSGKHFSLCFPVTPPDPASRSPRNLRVLLGAWLWEIVEIAGQSRGWKGVCVCLNARTHTHVEADGEHSPDSHVKKPLESRAGASFS